MSTVWREYKAFLTFTVSATTYRWGTVAELRGGNWFEGILSDWMIPTDSFRDQFGLFSEDRFAAAVTDPDGNFIALIDNLQGVAVDLELVTYRELADGSTTETTYARKGLIDSATREPGVLSIEILDLDRAVLEAEYPSKKFTVTDFPELFIDHDGLPVPVVVGTALKVPFVYGKNGAGVGPWVYYGPENLGSPSVLTVYRDGRIVAATEYTAATEAVAGTTYLKLTFTKEQVDFDGGLYEITADVQSSLSRNAGSELSRILTAAGLSNNIPTALADTEKMYVDMAYVQPRTFNAIVQDLLLVLRGHLYRDSSGVWQLVQDQAQSPVASYDELARDMVEVQSYSKPRRVRYVELEYYPKDSRQFLELKHVIRRDIGSGTGTLRYTAPYIRDHESADRLLDYLKKKEQYRAEARGQVHDVQLALGSAITLANSLIWTGNKDFIVTRAVRSEDRNELELTEYNSAVYTYTPGTLPPDATVGYQPDYSLTPPAAPICLDVGASLDGGTTPGSGVKLDADGKAIAYVSLRAVPSGDNWQSMWFSVKNLDTGEVHIAKGELAS